MKNDTRGVRNELDVSEINEIREPFSEVIRKISDVVRKYRNNVRITTEGTLTGESDKNRTGESERVSKVVINIELFTR